MKQMHEKISESIISNIDKSDKDHKLIEEIAKHSTKEIIKSGQRFNSELNTLMVPNLLNHVSELVKNDN